MEQALGKGNNIQGDIETTAQNLAKDKVFEKLVLKRMSLEEKGKLIPDRDKFEILIASGGFKKGFWMEYMQNLKGMANQPIQPQPPA